MRKKGDNLSLFPPDRIKDHADKMSSNSTTTEGSDGNGNSSSTTVSVVHNVINDQTSADLAVKPPPPMRIMLPYSGSNGGSNHLENSLILHGGTFANGSPVRHLRFDYLNLFETSLYDPSLRFSFAGPLETDPIIAATITAKDRERRAALLANSPELSSRPPPASGAGSTTSTLSRKLKIDGIISTSRDSDQGSEATINSSTGFPVETYKCCCARCRKESKLCLFVSGITSR